MTDLPTPQPTEQPLVADRPSTLAKVTAVAGKALVVAKWLWSIPFIKSQIATKLTQASIAGAVAVAVLDKVAS